MHPNVGGLADLGGDQKFLPRFNSVSIGGKARLIASGQSPNLRIMIPERRARGGLLGLVAPGRYRRGREAKRPPTARQGLGLRSK